MTADAAIGLVAAIRRAQRLPPGRAGGQGWVEGEDLRTPRNCSNKRRCRAAHPADAGHALGRDQPRPLPRCGLHLNAHTATGRAPGRRCPRCGPASPRPQPGPSGEQPRRYAGGSAASSPTDTPVGARRAAPAPARPTTAPPAPDAPGVARSAGTRCWPASVHRPRRAGSRRATHQGFPPRPMAHSPGHAAGVGCPTAAEGDHREWMGQRWPAPPRACCVIAARPTPA